MLKSRIGLMSLLAAAMLGAQTMAQATQTPQIRKHGQRGMRNIIGPATNWGNKIPGRRDRHRAAVKAKRDAARLLCPPGMSLDRYMAMSEGQR